MISLETGLLYSINIGIVIGVVWGIRKMILLERKILETEKKIEDVVSREPIKKD